MRILASTKPLTGLPKPPYDGFFECVSFRWAGLLDSGLGAAAHFVTDDVTLLHQLDAVSTDLLDATLAAAKLEWNVLYEQSSASGTFVYLKVNLPQTTIVSVTHRAVAGGSAVPLEELKLSPSAVNGTFYDEGGKELGRTSFPSK